MKLGISYLAFEGEELLPYAINSIRNEVDFISVIYQDLSFFGNPAPPNLLPFLKALPIDKLVCYEPDLALSPKLNELKTRNLGLDLSIEAGCTHHISADVDELYISDQLRYVKDVFDGKYSIVELIDYYKKPTYRIVPNRGVVSFIHRVEVRYNIETELDYWVEGSRRPDNADGCIVFGVEEFAVHHMSFVRRDIRKKIENSRYWHNRVDKFMSTFDKYEVGSRLCLGPDYLNRKTVLVPDIFNIGETLWDQHQ